METIFHYSAIDGCFLSEGLADFNPLDNKKPLHPAYSTDVAPPATGLHQCARYLDERGAPPALAADGEWIVQPDWRHIELWETGTGISTEITEPNVTPSDIGATDIPYPGRGYIWSDTDWVYDTEEGARIVEAEAVAEQGLRLSKANQQIAILKPAVDGGYAKPEHTQLLADWQRCRYELTLVPEQPGWPEKPQWPTEPEKVI
ncbi:tail fiber assembly protein [Aeromonas veronii]|uniref:tail fiber assembly protein n=1 Tax=Aeromonas veronii TaxID=654 RepID=UPI0018F1F002|nr:tail fiber assembly protein [Aeromonas veronii]MBJ7581640.1 tail fiber assembly protein [Aeromonas veronii]